MGEGVLHYVILVAILILGVAAGTGKFIDLWLREGGRKRLVEGTTALWVQFEDAGPSFIVRAPLRAIAIACDVFLGERLVSKRAFGRSFVLATAILVTSLAIAGGFSGQVMGFKAAPWTQYYSQLEIAAERADEVENQEVPEQEGMTPELEAELKQRQEQTAEFLRGLRRYRTPGWAATYTFLLAVIALLMNGFLDFILLALTRHVLRELDSDHSFVMFLAVLLFDATVAAIALVLTLFVVSMAATPVMWFLVPLVFEAPFFLSLGIVLGWSFGAWFLGGLALQVIAITSVAPLLIGGLAVALSLVVYPFRHLVHRFGSAFLLRAAEHKHSPIAFATSFLLIVAGLVTLARGVIAGW